MTKTGSLLRRLATDPSVLAFQLDLNFDRVLLAEASLELQAAAPFHDQRLFTGGAPHEWTPWADFSTVAAAMQDAPLGYIFHVGHCGSTLLSQLVAAATGVRALREPLPLRTIAMEVCDSADGAALLSTSERRARLCAFERIWSRSGGCVVKATSMCGELAAEVSDAAPIVFIYVAPETYLAAMLGGPNAAADLRNWAQVRFRRLRRFIPDLAPLASLSIGELGAMSWLAEAGSIVASGRDFHSVDFDRFLETPVAALSAVCRHLRCNTREDQIEAVITSPLMRRYAKAPDHPYDAAQRAAILAEDRARCAPEIEKGLAWLEKNAARFPAGDAAMARFSR